MRVGISMKKCPKCNFENEDDAIFCAECGESLPEKEIAPKSNNMFNTIMAVILAVLVLLSGVLLLNKNGVISGFSSKKASAEPVVYIDKGQLCVINTTGKKATLAEDLSGKITLGDGEQLDSILDALTFVSDDNSYLFYPSDVSNGSGENKSFEISCYNLKDDSTTVIDEDVESYKLSKNNLVTFKKSNNSVYQFDLSKNELRPISYDAKDYYVSKDGSKVVVNSKDNNLSIYSNSGTEKTIDYSIGSIEGIKNDFSTVYYSKDNVFRKFDLEKGVSEAVAEDVSFVIQTYDSGEAYYLKDISYDASLADFVEDDVPFNPDFSSQVSATTLRISKYQLCYYDGSASSEIAETYCDFDQKTDYYHSEDNAVIAFKPLRTDIPKVKLSECSSAMTVEVKDRVTGNIYANNEQCIAVGNKVTDLGVTDEELFYFSSSDDKAYSIGESGEVKCINITKDGEVKPESYDTNAHKFFAFVTDDGDFAYFKNYKKGNPDTGDLYVNKQLVSQNVDIDSGYEYFNTYNAKAKKLIVTSDWNNSTNTGKLLAYSNGKTSELSDGYSKYMVHNNGLVTFLADGKIYQYNGSDITEVVSQAESIVPIENHVDRSLNYQMFEKV